MTANSNHDEMLTLQEIFQFVSQRVPYIVEDTKDGQQQHPQMDILSLKAELPIYSIENP